MSTITKEQAKDLRNAFECWQQDYDPVEDKEQYDMFGLGMVAMYALLASLEAEPVVITDDMAYAFHHALSDSSLGADEVEEIKTGLRAAFANVTAPPAPVSVPETLPCPVLLEPGLRFGKGVKTKTMLNALQRRAEHYAELKAMTPEQRANHDAGMKEFAAMLQGAEPVTKAYKLRDAVETIRNSGIAIDAEKILAERDALNSPVIPDGLRLALSNAGIAAPESDEMLAATCEKHIQALVTWVKDRKPFHPAPAITDCWCRTCRPVKLNDMRFVVCPDCGNKRCPKANDHRNECTGSNEPGQQGSAYPAVPNRR